MSHLKERKEKNCLNCNAVINGKFCSICGQENLEPQESLWHLIVHLFYDITNFDTKFFSSVKYVVTKPGFLTAEYASGRRMSYLNPMRFYAFTSFLFFFIFFTFILDKQSILKKENKNTELSKKIPDKAGASLAISESEVLKKMENKNENKNIVGEVNYRDKKQYDSLKLLGLIKENWLNKFFIERGFAINEKYGNDRKKANSAFTDNLIHSIPQTLFFTLPLFALALHILYIRRRKHYYVTHVIFTIHLYIFIYINILVQYLFGIMSKFKYLGWLSTVEVILWLGIVYYAYRAMRNFYEQGRWKTLLKLFILCFALFFISIIFGILLFTLSIYKI